MIIWKYILLIIFHECCSEKELVLASETNICGKGNIPSCCFGYYYDNGECKTCKPGERSTDKRTCTPCPSNTYGERCKFNCKCTSEETCDPVVGCVNLKKEETTQSRDQLTDHTLKAETIEDPKIKITYFVLVNGFLIGVLVSCFAVGRLVFRRLSRKRPLSKPCREASRQNPTPLVVLPVEEIYHEI